MAFLCLEIRACIACGCLFNYGPSVDRAFSGSHVVYVFFFFLVLPQKFVSPPMIIINFVSALSEM